MLELWVARGAPGLRCLDRDDRGDETAIERAVLLDEITDELAAIECLATLEDALAEVRRQRRLEPSTADTDADTPE